VKNNRKKRKKQSLTEEGRASIDMKTVTVSGSWSVHSKGRGDCRLMEQGGDELIKLYMIVYNQYISMY